MASRSPEIDPESAFGELGPILSCDMERIYGPRIWMLYKDVCGGNVVKALGLFRGVQLGIISGEKLSHAIDNRGDGLDVDDVVLKVQEKLPTFNSAESVP